MFGREENVGVARLRSRGFLGGVAESGGFPCPALRLGVSKAAVSKQVARLEDRLGVRLLNRTTRRLSLTEAGATFYAACRRVLEEAATAERAGSNLSTAQRGDLTLTQHLS